MVDLAKQAFTTENFDLAADIYERNIKENGPRIGLYLGLADSCARSGNLQKAFEAYSHAYRLGKVSPNQLNHLVTSLVKIMCDRKDLSSKTEVDNVFSCGACKSLWKDPVTISCGHTFCRGCLEKEQSKNCKKCGLVRRHSNLSTLKTNVLLAKTVEKWFHKELAAIQLKDQGNCYFRAQKFKEAVEMYTEALKHAPNDHTIVSNRSHAFASIENYHEALEDANKTISLRPDWPKGYFRKGAALSGLGLHEEAAFAYLQCLSLDPSVASARLALAKALHFILSLSPPEDLKRAELQAYLNPFPLALALGKQAASDVVPYQSSFLSPERLALLKTSLRDSLAAAAATASKNGGNQSDEDKLMKIEININNDDQTRDHAGSHSTPSRCASHPNSPSSSPKLLGKRSRSAQSIIDQSSSHCSEAAATSLSPTKSCPPKLVRVEGCKDVPQELINKDDFECTLCYRLLYNPVTTPCGHVFCRQCLDRCMDHSSMCPLCKGSLAEYLAERRQSTTEALELIIQTYLREEYTERTTQHETEISDLARMGTDEGHILPIFVCTLAYPKIPCPLHIFEPRYRLMVRQCMESGTRQFGMCTALDGNDAQFADFGCMLEVRDVQYFPDGRSVVDTVGGKRFKVLSRGMRDGYHTAEVEFLQDRRDDENETHARSLAEIHNSVRKDAEIWIASLPPFHSMRIQQHMGSMPAVEQNHLSLDDGPSWLWWLVASLPLDQRAQLSIMAMTSLRERLMAISNVLKYISRRGGMQ